MIAGSKTINFKVKVNGVWQTEAGVIEILAKPKPQTVADSGGNFDRRYYYLSPAGGLTIPVGDQKVKSGTHYTYDAPLANINKVRIWGFDPTKMSCSAPGYSPAKYCTETAPEDAPEFDCGAAASLPAGECNMPELTVVAGWHRNVTATVDPATVFYQVSALDPDTGLTRWSNTQQMEYHLLAPFAAATFELPEGAIQATNYNLNVSYGSNPAEGDYNHSEGFLATHIYITDPVANATLHPNNNCVLVGGDHQCPCANGVCNIELIPESPKFQSNTGGIAPEIMMRTMMVMVGFKLIIECTVSILQRICSRLRKMQEFILMRFQNQKNQVPILIMSTPNMKVVRSL